MSTQLSTQPIFNLVPDQLVNAVSTTVGFLKSLIKWVLVVNAVGWVTVYWLNLVRIHLDLGQPNKAFLTLGLFIVTVFACIGGLYQIGVFDEIDLNVKDKFDIGRSTPT